MNPKIASIVPLRYLDLTREDEYFMALSYCVNDPGYLDFFKARSLEGKRIILDNSAVELGEPEEFKAYFEKAKAIGASTIMVPDIYQNPERTLAEAALVFHESSSEIKAAGFSVMVIPQGKTVRDWIRNALALEICALTHGISPVIGISCRYTDMFRGSRMPVALLLHELSSHNSPIHFLGCYADPRLEINPMLSFEWFLGVDSSYASVYASHGYELTSYAFTMPRPSRHIDFLNDVYNPDLLRTNLKAWREACLVGYQ